MSRRPRRTERPEQPGGGDCLHRLFEAQVGRTPDSCAVTDTERSLTYRELDLYASCLAQRLREQGVAAEIPVGFLLDRSVEMVVASLAILKAGGVCLPLDPRDPPDRVRFMMRQANTSVLLTQRGRLNDVARDHKGTLVFVEDSEDRLARARQSPPARVTAQNLAYIIYTSGSAGRPKGVALTHRGLVNHAVAMSRIFELRESDTFLQFSTPVSDISLEELYPVWHAGGTVVLRPAALPILGTEWLRWLQRVRVTAMDLPTAYWERWVQDLATSREQVPTSLRLLVVGGEEASPTAYAAWLAVGGSRVRWLNTYGPTDSVRVMVLDADLAPVPTGEVGELHIGGVGVARGYVNHPGLTDECFLVDPAGSGRGGRLYRTGDLVRQRPDGNLEFVGRIDRQVKVQGTRVEPEEVEAVLRTHPCVDQAVVVGHKSRLRDARLVAYVQGPAESLMESDLRAHLRTQLPERMIPASFVFLDVLPLTANGKLDRAALPAPPFSRGSRRRPFVAASGATEAALSAVWAEVLGLDEVGADDNFFELGGHSLLALQVVFRARERIGVELPTDSVFRAPTVRSLAALAAVSGNVVPAAVPLVAAKHANERQAPLSLQQEWMWDLEMKADPAGLYNTTTVQRFERPVDVELVRRALRYLVRRHEILRTSFQASHGQVVQTMEAYANVELAQTDLTDLPGECRDQELQRCIRDENARAFNLSKAPLFRAHLCRLGDETAALVMTFDHLICDVTSIGILMHEVRQALGMLRRGLEPRLPPLPLEYADFARWQRAWAGESLDNELAYWKAKLRDMPLGPGIPFDRLPSKPERVASVLHLEIPPATSRAIRALGQRSGSSPFPIFVAAVQVLIARRSGRSDVVVSTMLNGRYRQELQRVVGLFAGVVRLRADLSGSPSLGAAIGCARAVLLEAMQNQNIPFGWVRDALMSDHRDRGDLSATDLALRPQSLPVDVQYLPASWDTWHPGSIVLARHPRHGGHYHYFERGQRHPLALAFFDDHEEMWGSLSYKPAFYDESTMKRLGSDLEALLRSIAASPDDLAWW